MNAVDGLWPEEETASAGAGTASTSADDPFAPEEEAAGPADAGDSGAGFFFMPADAEPEAPSPRGAADSPFLADDDALSSPASEPERAAVDHRRSHNRLSIRPAPPEPQRTPARGKPRSAQSAVGHLAKAVVGLRELESEMGATLVAADRALRALGGRDVYECAGFASYGELEQRLVRAAPFLQALRVAVRRSGATLGVTGRAEQQPKRTTKALVTISRVLHRLRGLEDQVSQQALHARQALGDIERERLYEECGYTSFEDFLERALGPSPLLSCAVALVDEPPAEEVTPPPLPAETPEVAVGFEAIWSGPEPEPEPAPPPSRPRVSLHAAFVSAPTVESPVLADVPAPAAPPVEPTGSPLPVQPRRLTHAVLTVVLALVATGIGVASAHTGLLRFAQVERPDASVLGEAASPASSAIQSSSTAVAPAHSATPAAPSPSAARPAKLPTADAITLALSQALDAAKSSQAATAEKTAAAPRKRSPGK